jgi:hypothetical protein
MLLSGIPERPFPKVSSCDQGLGHELTGVIFQAKDPAWGTVTSQPHHTSNPLIFRVVQNKKTRRSGHPAVGAATTVCLSLVRCLSSGESLEFWWLLLFVFFLLGDVVIVSEGDVDRETVK